MSGAVPRLQTSDLSCPFIGSLLEVPQTADSTEKIPGMMAKLYLEVYWKRNLTAKHWQEKGFKLFSEPYGNHSSVKVIDRT
jgi:hypothetical protein